MNVSVIHEINVEMRVLKSMFGQTNENLGTQVNVCEYATWSH